MINLCFEGARGLGKSEISKYVREHTVSSTLVNHTGFGTDGLQGLYRVIAYYNAWTNYFREMKHNTAHTDTIFIQDRYFFSEMVYSKLHKNYDFRPAFLNYLKSMPRVYDRFVFVLLVQHNTDELKRNLGRDKIALFGEKDESVTESLIQQVEYLRLFHELTPMKIPNLELHIVDVTGRTIKQIGDEVLAFIN